MPDKKQSKVLMIDSETTWRGGEGQLLLLMKGLKGTEFEVTLAAPPDSAIAERARDIGVECLPLPIAGGMDLVAAWTLRRYLREHGFDIVHCHSSHAHSIAFVAQGTKRLRGVRPMRGRAAIVVSRRVDFDVAKNRFSSMKYRHGADTFLAISKGVRDVLLKCGLAPDRIRIVRSGIDLGKFAKVTGNSYLLEEFNLDPDTPVIGNVAALAPHKSQVDFIRAAKFVSSEMDNARFFIVGEGALRPRLEALIKELDMGDKITMTGFRKDVLEMICLLDCFVLSSYLEGLCTSIMDAHSLGVPVVATRTGGVPDIVENGVTGLLVPPREPERMGKAILKMLGNSELRKSCVVNAKTQSESYDYRNMVNGTLDAYRSLIGQTATVS